MIALTGSHCRALVVAAAVGHFVVVPVVVDLAAGGQVTAAKIRRGENATGRHSVTPPPPSSKLPHFHFSIHPILILYSGHKKLWSSYNRNVKGDVD